MSAVTALVPAAAAARRTGGLPEGHERRGGAVATAAVWTRAGGGMCRGTAWGHVVGA